MDNGNGAEGFTAVNDLSIDNHTFDQHIDAQQSARSIAQPNTTNLGTSLLTAEGQIETVHSYGDENTRFIRIQRQPTEVDGAYFCNILPVPALDCYEHMQPPSEKIGKFMKHPEMYRLEKRLESFKIYRWPLLNPSPSALAKAGYFFEGSFEKNGKLIKDKVECYKCGLRLHKWEKDDDPIEEHMKRNPQCFEVCIFCHKKGISNKASHKPRQN